MGREFEQREHATGIAAREADELSPRIVVHRERATETPRVVECALQERGENLGSERHQSIGAHAGKERRRDRARRRFGGGTDKDDRAGLNMREKRILLRAAEAVQLVDEEERLFTVSATLRCSGHRLAHLGDTVARCGEAGGDGAHGGSDHRRKRRLAGARRPPEEQRWHLTAIQESPQRRAGPYQRLLAHHLVDRRRPHPRSERRRWAEGTEKGRVVAHAPIIAPHSPSSGTLLADAHVCRSEPCPRTLARGSC